MENRHIVERIKTTYMDAHKPKTLKHVEAVADTAVWVAGIHGPIGTVLLVLSGRFF